MWIKYKHRFAYGEDRKWSYIEIPDDWKTYGYDEEDWKKKYEKWTKDEPYDEDIALGEYLSDNEEITDQYNHSDKYRGFKYERVDGFPPNEEIMERLERAQSNANYWLDESSRLRDMLDKTGILTKKDTDIT